MLGRRTRERNKRRMRAERIAAMLIHDKVLSMEIVLTADDTFALVRNILREKLLSGEVAKEANHAVCGD